MIGPELATFLQSGISILFGTRDERLCTDCGRAMGARVEKGGAELTVFLPNATAGRSLANLRQHPQLAVCFCRVIDHHSIQLKGQAVAIRAATAKDRATIDRYRAALAESWAFIGVPAAFTRRMRHWPCHAVRMRVESIFIQTPGPGAGGPLGAPQRRG